MDERIQEMKNFKAAINMLWPSLMDENRYRNIIRRVTGKSSLREIDEKQQSRVYWYLRLIDPSQPERQDECQEGWCLPVEFNEKVNCMYASECAQNYAAFVEREERIGMGEE